MPLDGILNIDKPQGWTSFDVVRFIRNRSGIRRVGHAGTLDPAATGVLPVLLGRATRLTEYLVDATKTYMAAIQLGLETDTYDAEGRVLSRTSIRGLDRGGIEAALKAFVGDFYQTPPAYSALKQEGVPLYKRARSGESPRLTPRHVRVDELDIIEWSGELLTLRIVSGKGFYVRSLAHDLGAALGVGGTLVALQRERVGPFGIDNAASIESLRAEFEAGDWTERVTAADEILLDRRAAILSRENALRLSNGRSVPVLLKALVPPRELCRAYSVDGDFVAVVSSMDGALRPEKVFTAGS